MSPDALSAHRLRSYLQRARARVAAGWTQRAYGRLADGTAVGFFDSRLKDAPTVCVRGAIYAVAGDARPSFRRTYREALSSILEQVLGSFALASWNDAEGRTQAEVVALYDQALTHSDDELLSLAAH